jgi:homoaconitate hydratase
MGLLLFSAVRLTPRVVSRRRLATVAERRKVPQTVIEKIVQKYAVGLPAGKLVKAGDYVMIRPEYVMTHDNTGPVISKFVMGCPRCVQLSCLMVSLLGSNLSGPCR